MSSPGTGPRRRLLGAVQRVPAAPPTPRGWCARRGAGATAAPPGPASAPWRAARSLWRLQSRAGPRGGVTAARRRRALSGSRGGSQRSAGVGWAPRRGRRHPCGSAGRSPAALTRAAAPALALPWPRRHRARCPPGHRPHPPFRNDDWAAAEIPHGRLALGAVNPGAEGGRPWTRRCAVRGWLSRPAPLPPRLPPRSPGTERREGRWSSRSRRGCKGQRPCRTLGPAQGPRRRIAAPGGKLRPPDGAASASAAGAGCAVRTWAGCPRPDGHRSCLASAGARRAEEGEAWEAEAGGSPQGPLCPAGSSAASGAQRSCQPWAPSGDSGKR
ncbi:collagen alpha-2(I) chain-like [Pseudopipra pipra]|uniref:collagen alpha-2(I) chain-like n=1 Tax=Pseudopipra pipra TaxID=415032 RepID=UPI003138B35F